MMETYEFIELWPGEEADVKISIHSTLLFMILLIFYRVMPSKWAAGNYFRL